MTAANLLDDMEIAPGYTVKCWKKLSLDTNAPDSEDWRKAVHILDTRISRRFLDPVDELMKIESGKDSKKTFGFAILAIDFLVVETLQGFREGITNHNGQSARLIKTFLSKWSIFKSCLPSDSVSDTYAALIYKNYRCALHHSGATDGDFRVRTSGNTFDFKNVHEVKINRIEFHKHLKCEFHNYLENLLKNDAPDLRVKFKIKMDAICGIKI